MAVLRTSQIIRINEESLRLLWETGVQVDDDGIVALLGEIGCKVDKATRVVKSLRNVTLEMIESL